MNCPKVWTSQRMRAQIDALEKSLQDMPWFERVVLRREIRKYRHQIELMSRNVDDLEEVCCG